MESYVELFQKEVARSRPFWEMDPVNVEGMPWVHYSAPVVQKPMTEFGGKWIIFLPADQVSATWKQIQAATLEGKLGCGAKVATGTADKRPICVFTYDWRDHVDVLRVREELRRMGVTDKIPYKINYSSLKGVYSSAGYHNISKYYE